MILVKSLVALATEKLLLKTSGQEFLDGIDYMYRVGLAPDRLSVMETSSGKFILQFHSRCDLRPFAANYPNFQRLLRGIVHVRAWHIKSIEFLNVDFKMADIPDIERTIDRIANKKLPSIVRYESPKDVRCLVLYAATEIASVQWEFLFCDLLPLKKLEVSLVLLRNCTFTTIMKPSHAYRILMALNRKKHAVVCEYGDDRFLSSFVWLKDRVLRGPQPQNNVGIGMGAPCLNAGPAV
uniref:DUF38 domain-containing protein n=1 Tax=Ascaris lumbricoides TaxID=6252 RepID=A0A9J2PM72_ASCLU